MARSPLTLAATVTSALPRVGVVGVRALTEGANGRYDTALVDLDDGRQVVVRTPTDAAAATELAAQARALRTLTPGVRALLPFQVPELLGESGQGADRAIVVDFVDGFRVDAAHLPPGRGAATAIGAALAAVHAMPSSIVRAEGLSAQTSTQLRDDVSGLLDRVDATSRAPVSLLSRWRRAIANDALWRFESTVVLGGAAADDFLLDDDSAAGPRVVGILEWHGLAVGDPAIDLRWLASAPLAAEDVFESYAAHAHRAPDAAVRIRARLYAELEFAKWLVHGHEAGRDEVVDDAVGLLESLADGVRDDDLIAGTVLDVEDAIALLDRVPASSAAHDTSMQTDAYDPAMLSSFFGADDADDEADSDHTAAPLAPADDTVPVAPLRSGTTGAPLLPPSDDTSTAPIDITTLRSESDTVDAQTADQADAERASRAALHRWASSGSE
ncbi:MAG: aminoglycoside phosphotransferase [Actinobacteria bacterium]|nr:aminoglycoside phosphotransferase [Actinomycetota bacterium]